MIAVEGGELDISSGWQRGAVGGRAGRGKPRVRLGVTREGEWSTEFVPLNVVRHWKRRASPPPVPHPGPPELQGPGRSLARWWANLQGSSAGVADVRYGPPVQLRPLWRSGSDLFVLRPGQSLLPRMCPGGATGLSTLRREALPAQPPGSPGPCAAAASLPGPASKSDASGFTRPTPCGFTGPRVACVGTAWRTHGNLCR